MPLGGRDQNEFRFRRQDQKQIPQCPWGGEIKTAQQLQVPLAHDTTMPLGGRDQNSSGRGRFTFMAIPQCPWGGEIKTRHAPLQHFRLGYHNALGGARSKHAGAPSRTGATDTTMPLGGRDQNPDHADSGGGAGIPQCPWGGEIKTSLPHLLVSARGYHNALGGARSKQV